MDKDELNKIAWKAVHEFERQKYIFESFAEAMIGHRVPIIAGNSSGSYTDGKSINISPPIELGYDEPHVKTLCDKRSPTTGRQLCKACSAHEDVLVMVFHEIGHNALESFSMLPDAAEWKRERILELTGRRLTHVNCFEYASRCDPYGAIFLNAVEDARIDTLAFKKRPGYRDMMLAFMSKTFKEGSITLEGHEVRWDQNPIDSQICAGVLVKLFGMEELLQNLDPMVSLALADDEIVKLIEKAKHARDVFDSLISALEILGELRKQGFMSGNDDPGEEESGDGESSESGSGKSNSDKDESGDGESGKDNSDEGGGKSSKNEDNSEEGESDEGESGEGESGEGESDEDNSDESKSGECESGEGESGEGESGEGESDEGESDEGESGDGKSGKNKKIDANELAEILKSLLVHPPRMEKPGCRSNLAKKESNEQEAIELALRQALYFDDSSADISGLTLIRFKGSENVSTAISQKFDFTNHIPYVGKEIPEGVLSKALLEMRIAFEENRHSKYNRNLKSGKINSRSLGKRAPIADERLFKKRSRPGKRDYAVSICMDVSGSIGEPNKFSLEKMAVLAQAELLNRMGIKFAVYAHSGYVTFDSGHLYRMTYEVVLAEVKSFNEPFSPIVKKRVKDMPTIGANLDGHVLEFLRKDIQKQNVTDRLIMYYSDGSMPLENYAEEKAILKREINNCKQLGIGLCGVGIQTDSPSRHGLDTVIVNNSSDIPAVVRHIEKHINM